MGRVLLVDDERDLTEACSLSLSLAGHEVTVANDGAEALSILSADSFDLVITDLRMPRLDGFTLLRWIVSHKPGTKVIVMTAFGSPLVSDTARRLGALHCLNKPVSRERLLERVAAVLGESGVLADIKNITVADYVQLCMHAGKTSVFEVSSGKKKGAIAVVEGTVAYAEQGDLRGERAFFEIISWERGQITEKTLGAPPAPNVQAGGPALLLEALRLADHARTAGQPESRTREEGSPRPPEAAAPGPDAGSAPAPASDHGEGAGGPPPAEPAPAASVAPPELEGFSEKLSRHPQVTEYGIFVEQDLLRYRRSATGAINNSAPSLYLKLGDILKEQLQCGALRYVLIAAQGGARYMVFQCLNARAVVGLRPDARPEDLWKDFWSS